MEKKMTAMEKAIKDLRRINTASTIDTADILERDYLPLEREQIEEACVDMLNRGDDISPDTVRSIVSNYITQNYGK